MAVLPLETGFEAPGLAVIGEQDILGDRLVRKSRGKRGSDVLTEASSLSVGDLVVHSDHGIGRFAGLTTIEAAGEPHDCLEVHYAGGDKLYLPVENIELLSRYGSDEAGAQLDRLGGVAWQTPQGPSQAAHPRHGREADQGRRAARAARSPGVHPARRGSTTSSRRVSPTRRPRTRRPASTPCSTIWPAGGRWTG